MVIKSIIGTILKNKNNNIIIEEAHINFGLTCHTEFKRTGLRNYFQDPQRSEDQMLNSSMAEFM